ncbi:TraR/DksA C4-type zinc finger protein [Jeotgalibacillus sp. ET6]|uniref:TraR/DksA C4-type zinc finger protein n=1 Tax=Jeotgalibacillus sp. ET6 TaxID=3037260 RepID=UPI002418539C|nr:TraR/DksA C4-type zinc finger protein [Jeotgalibacillus sp. ET6]MDG5473574.1 TraR/DksA C4-type zinc finger protein [Jeotgalibacillus sp. ET6]
MLSNEQINKFKERLLKQKRELTEDQNDKADVDEYSTELSQYDNHPADNATDLFDRELDMALNEHSEEELEKVEAALQAIEEGTYGVCKVTGKDIPIERLEAMPTALTVVEAAEEQTQGDIESRPSEESVISPSSDHPLRSEEGEVRDYQNSFSEAARYGTSETPSDMAGDEKDYDEMYESHEDGDDSINELSDENEEEEIGTDLEGKDRRIYNKNE